MGYLGCRWFSEEEEVLLKAFEPGETRGRTGLRKETGLSWGQFNEAASSLVRRGLLIMPQPYSAQYFLSQDQPK